MDIKYFYSEDFMGFEIKTAQDVASAIQLGFDFINQDGAVINSVFEDYEDDEDDEDGEYEDGEERELTDEELTEDILKRIREGEHVFAGSYMPYEMDVREHKATTLQTDFCVGQTVFYLKDNKICSKQIYRILLSSTANCGSCDDYTTISVKGGSEKSSFHYKGNGFVELATARTYRSTAGNLATAFDDFEVYEMSEIFATKDELVKHLLEED